MIQQGVVYTGTDKRSAAVWRAVRPDRRESEWRASEKAALLDLEGLDSDVVMASGTCPLCGEDWDGCGHLTSAGKVSARTEAGP